MQTPLQQLGHKVERRNNLAVVQAIQRTEKGLRAASDLRKHGKPAGY
jgi:gamma-glutamyltranspeptidase